MKNSPIRNIMQASLIGTGFFAIWALLLLPSAWIYDRLAIRAAFGRENGRLPAVSVVKIEKPATVTFSNGVVADVGYFPAAMMSAFHLAAGVVGSGIYVYAFRRQIRIFINATSQPPRQQRLNEDESWRSS